MNEVVILIRLVELLHSLVSIVWLPQKGRNFISKNGGIGVKLITLLHNHGYRKFIIKDYIKAIAYLNEVIYMMLMKYYKIHDNELCPCGSEKTYLECCKNRKDKPVKKSKKPLNIQIMEQFRKNQIKCCLFPDSSRCVKHIKEAHALQNNKIISQLAEDGHVYILNSNKPPQVIPIENEEPEILTMIDRVGVNHATTATCFCDIHDDEVFAPIEKGAPAFDKDSDEHKYIYAYKAFIFEYYKKLVEQKVSRENITNTPSVAKNTTIYTVL